jgi:Bacterial Ig-like domain
MASFRATGRPAARGRPGLLLRAVLATVLASVIGPVSGAAAEAPQLTITWPTNGRVTNNQTPAFSGTTSQPFNEFTQELVPVTLRIYAGGTVEGKAVQTLESGDFTGRTWSVVPAQPLAPGTYTAQAEQLGEGFGEPGWSEPVTFTVDTTPPLLTVSYPADDSSTNSESQLVTGTAGTYEGDLPAITINLFAGAAAGGQPLEALTVQASNGAWSGTFGGLAPGAYTAQAVQRDTAGNVGASQPVTFTVTTPPALSASPPVASFRWFPSAPSVGETVSLVSTSTDISSPITQFAWALGSNAQFKAGERVLRTSFSSRGPHPVRLHVSDANGLSSVVTETIQVSAAPLALMQPFPIVRIAGNETASGVKISLLTVQAPLAARVTVACKGRRCKTGSESRVARSSRRKRGATTVLLAFRRFERSLPAGVSLEIRVSKRGEIGKYTRFAIRRHGLPSRTDACLRSTSPKPIACPS